MKEESALQNTLLFLLLIALVSLTGLFFYHWPVYFNSDYAMVGLLAKGINVHGEYPLFVWGVGYQGMLFEGYFLALIFKVFGQNVYTLYSVAALLFWLATFLFYRVVKTAYDKTTGLLAALFFVVSSPTFYGLLFRPQPNYTEIFALGLAAFIVYEKILKLLSAGFLKNKKKLYLHTSLLGLLCGFGMYTYGQMAFFIGAICTHLFLFYLAKRQELSLNKEKFFSFVFCFGAALFFCGVLTFLSGFDELRVSAKTIKWSPFSLIKTGLLLALVSDGLNCVFQSQKKIKKLMPPTLSLAMGFLGGFALGNSPHLYFKYVLHGETFNRMRLGVSVEQFFQHGLWFMKGVGRFFNLITEGEMVSDLLPKETAPEPILLGFFLGVFLFVAMAFLYKEEFKKIKKARTGRFTDLSKISPLLFLLPVVFLIFCSTPTVMDYPNARYIASVVLTLDLALAVFLLWIFRNLKQGKITAILFLFFILANNTWGFFRKFKTVEFPYVLNPVAALLKERQIKHAYGDYWYAYALGFLTNEEILVEPLQTSLNARYKREVEAAQRVALILPSSEMQKRVGDALSIGTRSFRVVERLDLRGISVAILRLQKAR